MRIQGRRRHDFGRHGSPAVAESNNNKAKAKPEFEFQPFGNLSFSTWRNEWLNELRFLVHQYCTVEQISELTSSVKNSLGFDIWQEPVLLSAMCAEFVQLSCIQPRLIPAIVRAVEEFQRLEKASKTDLTTTVMALQLKSSLNLALSWKNYALDHFMVGNPSIDQTTFVEQCNREYQRVSGVLQLHAELVLDNFFPPTSVGWVVDQISNCYSNAMMKKRLVGYCKEGLHFYLKLLADYLFSLSNRARQMDNPPAQLKRSVGLGISSLLTTCSAEDKTIKADIVQLFKEHERIEPGKEVEAGNDADPFYGCPKVPAGVMSNEYVINSLNERKNRFWRSADPVVGLDTTQFVDLNTDEPTRNRSESPASQNSSKDDAKKHKQKWGKAKSVDAKSAKKSDLKAGEGSLESVAECGARVKPEADAGEAGRLEKEVKVQPKTAEDRCTKKQRQVHRVHQMDPQELARASGEFVCHKVLTSFRDGREVFYLLQLRDLGNDMLHLVLIRSGLALQHFPEDIAAHLEAQFHRSTDAVFRQ